MSVKEFWFSSMVAVCGTLVSAWLVGWDIALKALVFLMVLDYITGFLGAVRKKSVNSEVMFWGGVRKISILTVVALAVLFDQLFGNSEPVLRTLAILCRARGCLRDGKLRYFGTSYAAEDQSCP